MTVPGRLYEEAPDPPPTLDSSYFHHAMDLPVSGVVEGPVDLSATIDAYLGDIDVAGKRVLEIGPASGYVTFHMEARGADVVALEIPDDAEWEFVPQTDLDPIRAQRHQDLQRLRNGWWLAHRELQSAARVHHGSPYDIAAGLGTFDVAVMAAVLLHVREPLRMIEACSRVASTLVVTDRSFPELPDAPVMRLAASKDNGVWDTWWDLTPELVGQFIEILGFVPRPPTYTTVSVHGIDVPFFCIVASR